MSLVHDVIAELDGERERIWLTLPEDVRDLGNGIIPRLTGPKKQYFTSLLYADGEARTLADEVLWGLIELCRKPEQLDLHTLQAIVRQIVGYKADFFDFVGMPQAAALVHRYVQATQVAETLEEFLALTRSAISYVNKLHMWVDAVFPWGVTNGFKRVDA